MQKNNKYIKNKADIDDYYISKLMDYMIKNQNTFFLEDNRATSWCDFDLWPDKKIDRNHLILPDEVMLIDRDYRGTHTYCICRIGKDRKIKLEIPVIEVANFSTDYWRNGYFLLPNLNINQ